MTQVLGRRPTRISPVEQHRTAAKWTLLLPRPARRSPARLAHSNRGRRDGHLHSSNTHAGRMSGISHGRFATTAFHRREVSADPPRSAPHLKFLAGGAQRHPAGSVSDSNRQTVVSITAEPLSPSLRRRCALASASPRPRRSYGSTPSRLTPHTGWLAAVQAHDPSRHHSGERTRSSHAPSRCRTSAATLLLPARPENINTRPNSN